MDNCIYKIKSKINGNFYIGSAKNYSNRYRQHKHHLLKKTHSNQKLQNHVNKYGFDDLIFVIIQKECERLIEVEQHYINKLKPYFNIHQIANSPKGLKRTPEQIQRMKEGKIKNGSWRRGFKKTPEQIAFLVKINTGRKHTDKAKDAISKANKGRKLSQETKDKISKKLKGKIFSEETRIKISISSKGNKNGAGKRKPFTEEHKNKISLGSKGKIISNETRIKISESIKKYRESIRKCDTTTNLCSL